MAQKKTNSKKPLIILCVVIIVAVLGVIAFAAWYLLAH